MKKLMKILEKENKKTTLTQNECQSFCNAYRLVAKKYNLPVIFKDDFDYFAIEMMAQAIKNKELFEKTYEDTRNQKLGDIWNTIDYNQRNFMMNTQLDEIKLTMPHFENEGKNIWIPFLDELLNSLYDAQMVVFELPQFFKLYRVFNDKLVQRYHYGSKPFKAGFVHCEILVENEFGFGFYYPTTHCLYVIYKDETTARYPLALKLFNQEDHTPSRCSIIEAILARDEKAIIEALIQSEEIAPRSQKKLQKLLSKIGI